MGLIDGWDGPEYQKCPSIFFLLFCTQIIYIATYICNQKLSPTYLWVSTFDVTLWVVLKNTKLEQGGDFWFLGLKVFHFDSGHGKVFDTFKIPKFNRNF